MTFEDAGERRIEFDGAKGRAAIVFDASQVEQASPQWFDADFWGAAAQPVASGGRGGAWFIDAPFGACVLKHYLRGGLAARLSRASYLWQGEARARSIAEFRLMRELHGRGLPVPVAVAAWYQRDGASYRAALLMRRLHGVRSLASLAAGGAGPWEAAGKLVARMHQAGLDHADLNAENLLFDTDGQGWVIDLDRGRLRAPADRWRQANLERLHRSLLKLRGGRDVAQVEDDFAQLRAAYEKEWRS
jgi:3-deoxy-D-manno-octulosonic acid kinase